MNGMWISWLFELGRMTLALTVAALFVGMILRLARPKTPSLHRAAWCMVLLVGWLFVRVPVSVPWYESAHWYESAPSSTDFSSPNTVTDDTLAQVQVATSTSPLALDALTPEEPEQDAEPSVVIETKTSTEPLSSAAALNPVDAPTSTGGGTFSLNWPLVILGIWAAGIVVALWRWLFGYMCSIRRMSTALEPDAESCRQWRTLLMEHRVEREIPLRLTEGMGPLLCRWPDGYELVVPAKLWESLTPGVRLSVLRHELAHYERGDVWKSLLIRILALPHWFNPVAWWAVRRFDEAAEWACDEAALRDDIRSTEYARTLLTLAESSLAAGSCHPSMSRLNLTARVNRLVSFRDRTDSFLKKLVLGCLAISLLALCMVRIDLVAKTPEVTARPEVAQTTEDPQETTTTIEVIDEVAEPLTPVKFIAKEEPEEKETPRFSIDIDAIGSKEWKAAIQATEKIRPASRTWTLLRVHVTDAPNDEIIQASALQLLPLGSRSGQGRYRTIANHGFLVFEHINSASRNQGQDPILLGSFSHGQSELWVDVPEPQTLQVLGDVTLRRCPSEKFGLLTVELQTPDKLATSKLQIGPLMVGGLYGKTYPMDLSKPFQLALPEGSYKLLFPDFDKIKDRITVEIKPGSNTLLRYNVEPHHGDTETLAASKQNILTILASQTSGKASVAARRAIKNQTPRARASFLYQGKTFEQWKEVLETDLSVDTRVEAIKALAAFGAQGHGKEVAEILVKLMRKHGRDKFAPTNRTPLQAASVRAFFNGSTGTTYDGIRPVDGVPVLCRELKEGNAKSCGFVLCVLERLQLHKLGLQAKDMISALLEFYRQSRNQHDCNRIFKILLKIDPMGDSVAEILREELTKTPPNYPQSFVTMVIQNIATKVSSPGVNMISPGELSAIQTVSECLDDEHCPTSVRDMAILDLTLFLACLDTPTKSNSMLSTDGQIEGLFPQVSNQTLQLGQAMMEKLITAWQELSEGSPEEMNNIYKIVNILQKHVPNNPRVRKMAAQSWQKAYEAAIKSPGAEAEKREDIARMMYWVLAAKSSKPNKQKREHELVYRINAAYADPTHMKKIVPAVKQRVQNVVPSAVANQSGRQEISVWLEQNDETTVKQIDKTLSQPGTLEFRVLANRHAHQDLIKQAEKEKDRTVLVKEGKLLAWWVPVTDRAAKELAFDEDRSVTRKREYADQPVTDVLVLNDPYNITDHLLSHAYVATSGTPSRPSIHLSLNQHGSDQLKKLTRENLSTENSETRRRLGIILNGKLMMAPTIMSKLTEGKAIIMGGFTEKEAEAITTTLNQGSLPTPLKRVEKSALY